MTRPCETVFAWRAETIRMRRGETIGEFADACGVSRRSADNWLADRGEPLLSYALMVARATGYDLDDLVDPDSDLPAEPRRACEVIEAPMLSMAAVGSTAFTAELRRAMADRDVGPTELAGEIGVHRQQIHKWLRGDGEPRITSALRVSRALGVRLHDLAVGR